MTREGSQRQHKLSGAAATAVGDGRSLLEWACDADEYTSGRTRIRVHLLVDRAGQHHLATAVLHELREKGDGYA